VEDENMKGSLLAIHADDYLITTMFQSLEDSYTNNKGKFDKLLRSIKIESIEQ